MFAGGEGAHAPLPRLSYGIYVFVLQIWRTSPTSVNYTIDSERVRITYSDMRGPQVLSDITLTFQAREISPIISVIFTHICPAEDTLQRHLPHECPNKQVSSSFSVRRPQSQRGRGGFYMLAEVGGANGRSPARPFVYCCFLPLHNSHRCDSEVQCMDTCVIQSQRGDCSSRNYKDVSERATSGQGSLYRYAVRLREMWVRPSDVFILKASCFHCWQ